MERKFYKTPRTKLFSVELEGTFAGSADVANTYESTGTIDGQEINTDFEDSFSDTGWGTNQTNEKQLSR